MTLNLLSALMLFSSLVSMFLAFYAWQRRKNTAAVYLALLMVSATIWSLGYGLEISFSEIGLMHLVSILSYIGIATLPVFWLLFCISYTGKGEKINLKLFVALFIVPLITVIAVASNSWYHLFYKQVTLGCSNNIFFLSLKHGSLYYLHIVYSHIMVIAGIILIARILFKVSRINRKRISFLLAGAALPYITNLTYVFGFQPYGFLDLTPIGFISMGIVLTIGVFTVSLFEITPLALDLLFDSIPDAIFVVDTNNVILNSNPPANRLLNDPGFGNSGILRCSFNDKNQKASGQYSNPISRIEFSNRIYERSCSLIRNRREKIKGLLIMLRDITDRDAAEKAIRAAKEKAEENEKLKTAFLTNMSHEIRTPMNGILGFINLLKSMDITGDERAAYIEILNQSGQRLLDTINDIMAMSEIESGRPKPVISEIKIAGLLNYHLQFFRQQAREKGLELKLSGLEESENDIIHSDKNKLDGVLSNLIKNAIKFTASGYVEFGAKTGEGHTVFYVKDSGIGIDKEKQGVIFDRFMQVDVSNTRQYEGSGLGLSIVKAYVNLLGGNIWVESVPNEGSIFYVDIPDILPEKS